MNGHVNVKKKVFSGVGVCSHCASERCDNSSISILTKPACNVLMSHWPSSQLGRVPNTTGNLKLPVDSMIFITAFLRGGLRFNYWSCSQLDLWKTWAINSRSKRNTPFYVIFHYSKEKYFFWDTKLIHTGIQIFFLTCLERKLIDLKIHL